jgi:hypothetical protein
LFALAGGAAHALRVVVDGLELDVAEMAAGAAAIGGDQAAAIAAAARFVDEALAEGAPR